MGRETERALVANALRYISSPWNVRRANNFGCFCIKRNKSFVNEVNLASTLSRRAGGGHLLVSVAASNADS